MTAMIRQAPGYFGKLPARGDFLSRRVPAGLAAAWDGWLGLLTTAVREAAGPDWPQAWLTAPLWHFALGSDLSHGPGAAGVLIASMDRVGRMFPFTIIGPADGIPAEDWFDAVEAIALQALDDDADLDVLDAALTRLGAPLAGDALLPSQSLWRCRGSDRVAPISQFSDGLPAAATAAAMVLG